MQHVSFFVAPLVLSAALLVGCQTATSTQTTEAQPTATQTAATERSADYASADEIRAAMAGKCFKGRRDWRECYREDQSIDGYYSQGPAKGTWSVTEDATGRGILVLTYGSSEILKRLITIEGDGATIAYYTPTGNLQDVGEAYSE